jgi:hypothetical protein
MSRALFWSLIAVASACLALASACFAAAVFSDPLPRGSTTYAPYGYTEVFGRATSLDWSSDKGLLVATIALGQGNSLHTCLRFEAGPVRRPCPVRGLGTS